MSSTIEADWEVGEQTSKRAKALAIGVAETIRELSATTTVYVDEAAAGDARGSRP